MAQQQIYQIFLASSSYSSTLHILHTGWLARDTLPQIGMFKNQFDFF
jgi:hypothetical protein